MEAAEVDQFDSSSCEKKFSGCGINDLYGNQFVSRFRQK